jgi:hypothetical protein
MNIPIDVLYFNISIASFFIYAALVFISFVLVTNGSLISSLIVAFIVVAISVLPLNILDYIPINDVIIRHIIFTFYFIILDLIVYEKFLKELIKDYKNEKIKKEKDSQKISIEKISKTPKTATEKIVMNPIIIENNYLFQNQIEKQNNTIIEISNKAGFIKSIQPLIIKHSIRSLSNLELEQISNYIWLYKSNSCSAHWQVNQIISDTNKWHEFDTIRSLNDHGYKKLVKGIEPYYFSLVLKVLEISADYGAPLIGYEKY